MHDEQERLRAERLEEGLLSDEEAPSDEDQLSALLKQRHALRKVVCNLNNEIVGDIVVKATDAVADERYAGAAAGRALTGYARRSFVQTKDGTREWKLGDGDRFLRAIAICQMTNADASSAPCFGEQCVLVGCTVFCWLAIEPYITEKLVSRYYTKVMHWDACSDMHWTAFSHTVVEGKTLEANPVVVWLTRS